MINLRIKKVPGRIKSSFVHVRSKLSAYSKTHPRRALLIFLLFLTSASLISVAAYKVLSSTESEPSHEPTSSIENRNNPIVPESTEQGSVGAQPSGGTKPAPKSTTSVPESQNSEVSLTDQCSNTLSVNEGQNTASCRIEIPSGAQFRLSRFAYSKSSQYTVPNFSPPVDVICGDNCSAQWTDGRTCDPGTGYCSDNYITTVLSDSTPTTISNTGSGNYFGIASFKKLTLSFPYTTETPLDMGSVIVTFNGFDQGVRSSYESYDKGNYQTRAGYVFPNYSLAFIYEEK